MNKISITGFVIIFIIGMLMGDMGYGLTTWQFYVMITLIALYGITRFVKGEKEE